MGFLSASSTIVRYAAPVPPKIDREAVVEAVSKRLFRELDGADGDAVQSCGWVGLHDPLAASLSSADLFFQQWLVVGFRFDRRAVPAKLLWLERRRVEEDRKAQRGLERLGSTMRREIKEEVQARLLARALPTPRLFDCAWNLETGRLLFTGKARAPREAFVELFRQTFAVQPIPMIPYLTVEHVDLTEEQIHAVRLVEPASFLAPRAGAADPTEAEGDRP